MNAQTIRTAQYRRFSATRRARASLAFAALVLIAAPVLAQVAPPLGVVQIFGALGGAGVTGAAGAGVVVNGDVGSSPTATITNFPPSSVVPPFVLHLTNDGVVQQARTDATAASLNLASQGPGTVLTAQLNGVTLTSGIYSFAATADLAASGTLTLNGPGVFIFNVNSALTANVLSNVVGTANPCNVFWRVGTSATLNGNSFFGTVIADTGFVTVGAGANVTGRVVAATAVTMAGGGGNTIGGCSAAPRVTVTKVSNGGVGSFNFTGSNGIAAQTITTATPGTGVSGVPQTLTTAGLSTTITESAPPAGFTLASITCSGLGAGGTATPNLVTRAVTLDSAATASGSAIACTFTNTFVAAPPTVTLTKFSIGGVGTFNFTGNNGIAPQSITTLVPGAGVAGAPQTLTTAATITTITESAPPAGFTLTSITCSGLGAGGTATPNLGSRSVTLDAAATASGSAIACTFTNTFSAVPVLPTITVTKVSNGGVGTFNFTGSNGFAAQSITTAAPGVGVSGPTQALTAAGLSTTITESAPPAGFTLASITCSGLGAGGTATPNIATLTVTLDAAATAAGSAIACTFTNTLAVPIPTLSEWAMILLTGLLALGGFAALRRQER